MLEDVRLALNGVRPVEFLGRSGGNVPSHEEVLALVRDLARKLDRHSQPATAPVTEIEEEHVVNV